MKSFSACTTWKGNQATKAITAEKGERQVVQTFAVKVIP